MPTARQPTDSKPVLAWIDGVITPADSPALPALDQAYLSGMGAFETIRAECGMPLFLEAHLERLAVSAVCLDLAVPDIEVVRIGIRELLERQGFEFARIRVTVSGAIQADGAPFRFDGKTRTTLLAFPLQQVPNTPSRLITTAFRMDSASPLAGLKCTSYALHALAAREARAAGCDEALILDHQGYLTGCATSNLFWVRDGRVFTPDARCGCRLGITRERVMRACDRLGLPCTAARAKAAVLIAADEIFTTSSIREVRTVVSLDGKKPRGGGITKRIRAALLREIRLLIRRD